MIHKIEPRCIIQRHARLACELHNRVRETFKLRNTSPEARAEWSQACDEFHSQYDALAFPGGYRVAQENIQAGDNYAIENAIAFLEVRPYFFRSQYMRTKLIRLLKRAPLTPRQTQRLQKSLAAEKA